MNEDVLSWSIETVDLREKLYKAMLRSSEWDKNARALRTGKKLGVFDELWELERVYIEHTLDKIELTVTGEDDE